MFFIYPNLNIFKTEIIFTFRSVPPPFSLLSHPPNFPGQKSRIIFDFFFYLLLTLLNLKLYALLSSSTASGFCLSLSHLPLHSGSLLTVLCVFSLYSFKPFYMTARVNVLKWKSGHGPFFPWKSLSPFMKQQWYLQKFYTDKKCFCSSRRGLWW